MTFRFLLTVLLVLSASLADAAVLCVQKSGTVKVREVCKKGETQLNPVALGLRGPGAVVKDSNGKTVGPLLDSSGALILNTGDAVVTVMTTELGFVPGGNVGALYYESSNCSGQALMPPPIVHSLVFDAAFLGSMLYYPPVTGTLMTYSGTGFMSPLYTNQESCAGTGGTFIYPNTCCQISHQERLLGPARTFDVSGFVPPFHVEVQP